MSSDEETVCGVCGTSFSEVHNRTLEDRVVGNTRWQVARRAVNREGLMNLGAWLALVVSGLGLVLFTASEAPAGGSWYYYRFEGGEILAAGFFLGIILIVVAIGWAGGRLRRAL